MNQRNAWAAILMVASVAALGLLTTGALPPFQQPMSEVNPIVVLDSTGTPMIAPFLGGFDVPRPQLVDIDGDGDLDLFVQERLDQLIFFENVNGHFVWRTNSYKLLPIGEWYRFVDMDHDGVIDLLSEMPQGFARLWHNAGTKTAPHFVAMGDSLRDTHGDPIVVDRQNIPTAFDIDCNGHIDLFIGRIEGVLDRYEEAGVGPAGDPRFALHTQRWEGIEILGGEAGAANILPDSGGGPHVPDPMARHGANTLTFADVDDSGKPDLYWGDFFEAGLLRIRNQGTCAEPNFRGLPERFPRGHAVMTSGYNAPTFGDVDGDGLIDLVLGVIGGAYSPNATGIENLYLMKQAPKGKWTTVTKQLITQIDVGSESTPVLADLNGDGKLDLLIGNKVNPADPTTSSLTWFENTGSTTEPAFKYRGLLPIRGTFNYAPAVVDLDGDGLPDLVLGTWRDQLQFYKNTGTLTAPTWTLKDTALVTITRGSNTVPAFGDIDGDGLVDLIIGQSSGYLSVYRNIGTKTTPKFQLVADHFQNIKPGRRSAPALVDLDHPGKLDLLVGSEEGVVEVWRNVGTGRDFRFARDTIRTIQSYSGAAPTAGFLRGPGKPPVILVGTAAGGVIWVEYDTKIP